MRSHPTGESRPQKSPARLKSNEKSADGHAAQTPAPKVAPRRLPSFETLGDGLPSSSNTTITDGITIYHCGASGLSHGTSLGNARAWVASKGTGEMESLFSVESGMEVMGALTINYFSADYDFIDGAPPSGKSRIAPRTPLPPIQHGEFHFHAAYQQRSMTIVGQVNVLETLFVPRSADLDEPAAVYHVVKLTNASGLPRSVTVIGALHLPGATPNDMHGRYDRETGALVAWNASSTQAVRVVGLTPHPDEYALTVDAEQAYYPSGRQDGRVSIAGELFGVLGRTVHLAPEESIALSFLAVYSPRGEAAALATYRDMIDYEAKFHETAALYGSHLRTSDVRTPDPLLNQGAQWSKANMLRVMQRYHTTPSESVIAFTNDPGKGSNIVARDACWFSIGCDYFMPEVSRGMLEAMALLQEVSGKIVEYWNGLTGGTEDYGLNINDNTPLFVVAAAHHVQATGDALWAGQIYPAAAKAARYILSQRNEQGLVWCDATGTGAHGIAGWRNIIDGRTISGAVTEINCECYLALCDAAQLATIAGEAVDAALFRAEAAKLNAAIEANLKNPANGLYYLTINVHGQHESTVTADQVFPMIFHVADKAAMGRIMERLLMPDFSTDAGLRTLSSKNPLYRPDALVGLMGGVWPGITWWFALGCAHAESGIIVSALVSSYQHYLRDPGTYNTVPGQFSEWFDGETLINRGMRLSPWEPPRFLWAALEGAMGFGLFAAPRGEDQAKPLTKPIKLTPVVPESWQWFCVLSVPFHGQRISYFACMMSSGKFAAPRQLHFYGVGEFEADAPIERYDRDCSESVRSHVGDVSVTAFAREEGTPRETFLVQLGSMCDESRIVLVDFAKLFGAKTRYRVRAYSDELGEWSEAGQQLGANLTQIAARVEGRRYRLYEFRRL